MRRLIYIVVPALVEAPEHFDLQEATKKTIDHVYGSVLPVMEAESLNDDYQDEIYLSHDHKSNDYENCSTCIETARNGDEA